MRFGAAVDISSELQLHSLRAGHAAPGCTACRRRLLPGEMLHVYAHDRTLCTLCASAQRADGAQPLRSERVHAAPRQLAVVPRAA
jgi:hypothetical protein